MQSGGFCLAVEESSVYLPGRMYYFACGSNMLRERLKEREVGVRDDGRPAQVAGYSLSFNRRSVDGSSKANLMPTPGASAWGGLFSADPGRLGKLDSAEGAPNHYQRSTVSVRVDTRDYEAEIYLAQPDKMLLSSESLRPWDSYLALALGGATQCPGLPADWVRRVRRLGTPWQTSEPTTEGHKDAVRQLAAAGYRQWRELLDG